ncbi:MAG: hypothetical protein FJZ98_09750, partial [Chloroflexi bacterium]|nr:hypothetical protein [Chloroflexota bacterium]
MNSPTQIMHEMVKKNRFLVPLIIFLIFLIGYFYTSGLLEKSSAFDEFDILFEMDTPRAIEDMTVF